MIESTPKKILFPLVFSPEDITYNADELVNLAKQKHSKIAKIISCLETQSSLSFDMTNKESRKKFFDWMKNSNTPTYAETAQKLENIFDAGNEAFDRKNYEKRMTQNLFLSLVRTTPITKESLQSWEEKGAFMQISNKFGSLLHMAMMGEQPAEILIYLIEKVDINLINEQGETVLDLVDRHLDSSNRTMKWYEKWSNIQEILREKGAINSSKENGIQKGLKAVRQKRNRWMATIKTHTIGTHYLQSIE